jgi:hypothetical protein
MVELEVSGFIELLKMGNTFLLGSLRKSQRAASNPSRQATENVNVQGQIQAG